MLLKRNTWAVPGKGRDWTGCLLRSLDASLQTSLVEPLFNIDEILTCDI